MTRPRALLLVLVLTLVGCGAGIPPAGNYATVTGRVYDAATNTPIPGASVSLLVVLTGQSGPDGTYTVANVPSGQLDGTVSAPGYATYRINGQSVSPGQNLRIDVPLQKQQ